MARAAKLQNGFSNQKIFFFPKRDYCANITILRTEGMVVVPMLLHWAGQGVSVDFWWPGGGDLFGLGGWSFWVGVGGTNLT